MNSRQRLLAALDRRTPDRLPATTHHLMPSFLSALGGLSELQFFDRFELDAIRWVSGQTDNTIDPGNGWRVEIEDIPDPNRRTMRLGSPPRMVGGFDQFHHFIGCTPEETRLAVRRCFEDAGAGGGYILAPSDHFFEA